MATFTTRKVTGDLGSQEYAQLVSNYNSLLDVLGDLITGIKGSADHAALVVVATTAETAIQANVAKLEQVPNVPLGPTNPVPSL